MYIKNKRGQSTVEYILLVAAVIAVMIAFTTSPTGGLQSQLNSALGTAATQIGDVGSRLTNSEAGTTGSSPASNYDISVTGAF